jgi:hypothetical protein
LLDYKKADKIFRVGLATLANECTDTQYKNLQLLYNKFSDRMIDRIKKDISPLFGKIGTAKLYNIIMNYLFIEK